MTIFTLTTELKAIPFKLLNGDLTFFSFFKWLLADSKSQSIISQNVEF